VFDTAIDKNDKSDSNDKNGGVWRGDSVVVAKVIVVPLRHSRIRVQVFLTCRYYIQKTQFLSITV